jgi:hypothetical protein
METEKPMTKGITPFSICGGKRKFCSINILTYCEKGFAFWLLATPLLRFVESASKVVERLEHHE